LIFTKSRRPVTFLVPFAAGNCHCIRALDLAPEVKTHRNDKSTTVHTLAFNAGRLTVLGLRGI
jgi:hypothetical protein